MNYLSPEIKAMIKVKTSETSLIKRQNSCGIFQDYNVEEALVEPDTLD